MPNPMFRAFDAAAQATKKLAGLTVTYTRGAATVDIVARVGMSKTEIADQDGTSFEIKVRDWIVDAADLVLDAETVTPRRGDTITETVAGMVRVYEVLPVAGEETHRYSDATGKRWRIHTKLKSSEAE